VAHAYLSMSRHEGFGVPLIEAMHRDVPVVAYGAAAVPETMGGAGLVLMNEDPVVAAEALALLRREPSVRERVLAGQRRRLGAFDEAAIERAVDQVLLPALRAAPPARERPASGRPVPLVVCPGFDLHPTDAELTLELAARTGARVLALALSERITTVAPRTEVLHGVQVQRFTPDTPDAGGELPRSSSLESAVLASRGEVTFVELDSPLSRALLSQVGSRGSIHQNPKMRRADARP
jgi:hypothetical protein